MSPLALHASFLQGVQIGSKMFDHPATLTGWVLLAYLVYRLFDALFVQPYLSPLRDLPGPGENSLVSTRASRVNRDSPSCSTHGHSTL